LVPLNAVMVDLEAAAVNR